MANERELKIVVGGDDSQFMSMLERDSRAIDAASSAWKQRFGALTGIADTASVAMVGMGAATGMAMKYFVDGAVAATEAENLFEVTFANNAAAARAWSEQLSDAYKRNAYAVRGYAGEFAAVLKPSMGLDQATEMAEQLTKLAYDIESFRDVPIGDVIARLQSGLAGEAEAMRKLGVDLSEASLKTVAAAHGIRNYGAQTDEATKRLMRYYAILEQTTDAQGDVARTADSPANMARANQERFAQLRVELGEKLIPAYQKLLEVGGKVVDWLASMTDSEQRAFTNMLMLSTVMLTVGGAAMKTVVTIQQLRLQYLALRAAQEAAAVAAVREATARQHAAAATLKTAMAAHLKAVATLEEVQATTTASAADLRKAQTGVALTSATLKTAAATQANTVAQLEGAMATGVAARASTVLTGIMRGLGSAVGIASAVVIAGGIAWGIYTAYQERQARASEALAQRMTAQAEQRKTEADEIRSLGQAYDELAAKAGSSADAQARMADVKGMLLGTMQRISSELGQQIPQVGDLSAQWKAFADQVGNTQELERKAELLQAKADEEKLRAQYRTQYTPRALYHNLMNPNTSQESRTKAMQSDPFFKTLEAQIRAAHAKVVMLESLGKAKVGAASSSPAAFDPSAPEAMVPAAPTGDAAERYRDAANAARELRRIQDDMDRANRQRAATTDAGEREALDTKIRTLQIEQEAVRDTQRMREQAAAAVLTLEQKNASAVAAAQAAVDDAQTPAAKAAAKSKLDQIKREGDAALALLREQKAQEMADRDAIKDRELKNISEASEARRAAREDEKTGVAEMLEMSLGNKDMVRGYQLHQQQMRGAAGGRGVAGLPAAALALPSALPLPQVAPSAPGGRDGIRVEVSASKDFNVKVTDLAGRAVDAKLESDYRDTAAAQ